MGKVQELKHAAKLREWSTRVAECRSSGSTVKTWCEGQGITLKHITVGKGRLFGKPPGSMCYHKAHKAE